MIRVKFVRCVGGGVGHTIGIGEILTLPDVEAQAFIAAGKAVAVIQEAPDDGSPSPRHQDPSPTRRR